MTTNTPDPSTAPGAQQAQPGTEPQQQQAPSQQPQQSPSQAAPLSQELSPEEIAALRQQNEELRQQNQQLDTNYRHLQGAYTQTTQQVRALTGLQQPPQPQQSPAEIAAQKLATQYGIHPDDAKKLGPAIQGLVNEAVAPLQQQFQQTQQAVNYGFQVDQMLGSVAQANQGLFTNPAVWDQTRAQALSLVMQGGKVDPQFMEHLAVIANHELTKQQPRGTTQQPMQQTPNLATAQPFAGGMFNLRPNFQPQPSAQPAARQLSPEAQAYERELLSRYPAKKT